MVVLAGLSGLLIGAAVAWRAALAWANAEVGRVRARMQDQIGYWQDQAERARASAAHVAEQTAAWVAGCRQGREDVLSLAPPWPSTALRPAKVPRTADFPQVMLARRVDSEITGCTFVL